MENLEKTGRGDLKKKQPDLYEGNIHVYQTLMSWEMFATTKSNIQHICKTMKRWKSSLMLVKCGKEMPD